MAHFQVVPQGSEWQVLRDGTPVANFEGREDAIDRAETQADSARPSEVTIYTENRNPDRHRSFPAPDHPTG